MSYSDVTDLNFDHVSDDISAMYVDCDEGAENVSHQRSQLASHQTSQVVQVLHKHKNNDSTIPD